MPASIALQYLQHADSGIMVGDSENGILPSRETSMIRAASEGVSDHLLDHIQMLTYLQTIQLVNSLPTSCLPRVYPNVQTPR